MLPSDIHELHLVLHDLIQEAMLYDMHFVSHFGKLVVSSDKEASQLLTFLHFILIIPGRCRQQWDY
jgi:hypothetical protein